MFSVVVNFGSCECQDYDDTGFSTLKQAKNYCNGLVANASVTWIEEDDSDLVMTGTLGMVNFAIYRVEN